jgi:hypothetical protein
MRTLIKAQETGRHVEEAPEEENRCRDRDEDRQKPDHCQQAHEPPPAFATIKSNA